MNNLESKHILYVIIIALLCIIIYKSYNKQENFAGSILTPQSNEAVQNIAQVYANSTGIATFNNVNITGNVNAQILDANNFKGIIVAWSGEVSNIPTGWALCDGANGTPNLGGRFILGAGEASGLTTRSIGETGGEENHTLSLNEMNHSHANTSGTIVGDGGPLGVGAVTSTASPHNNMPPFYTLAYIIKL